MNDNVINLPCTHKVVELATAQSERLKAENDRAIRNIDWHAKAAFQELEKATPNISVARNFIRRILATTTGQQS